MYKTSAYMCLIAYVYLSEFWETPPGDDSEVPMERFQKSFFASDKRKKTSTVESMPAFCWSEEDFFWFCRIQILNLTLSILMHKSLNDSINKEKSPKYKYLTTKIT